MDASCPGAPRKIRDDEIERLFTLTLQTQSQRTTHWPTRALARQVGLSQTRVSRVWAGLWPPAAPGRDVQAFLRPDLCGQDKGRGGAPYEPSR